MTFVPATYQLVLILRDNLAATLQERAKEHEQVSVVTIPGRGGYTICQILAPRAEAIRIRNLCPEPPQGMWIGRFNERGKLVREPGYTDPEWAIEKQARKDAILQVQPRPNDPVTGLPLPALTTFDLKHVYAGHPLPVEEEEPEP